jgi:endonuclease/exonuclease/phosphatase family metal-dependent hydrolase
MELKSGDTIRFVATHLDYKKESPDRIQQVKTINAEFVRKDYPTILAGDLNATPESKSISILKKYWTNSYGEKPEPTHSSSNPTHTIDYIMYQPAEQWEVLEHKVICDAIASDHCVVFTELVLKN